MAESTPLAIQVGAEKVYWLSRTLQAESQIADLTRERDSLALQLDSCQGALREVIVENSANYDRAEKAEQDFRHERAAYLMCVESREETETALAEARQHIAHLEDQLADAETARTLALGIAERAEQERDEAKQALVDRTGVPTIRGM